MKILLSSHAFAPQIGGIETVSALLAQEFVLLGHEVMVVTQTAAESTEDYPYRVLRRPSLGKLVRAIQWCDIFWQNNLSLRTIWPALLLSRPVLITHQGSYCRRPAGLDLLQRLKYLIVERTASVAPSRPVATCFRTKSTLIPNPYDARIFHAGVSAGERAHDLIFLGRLVSEKGIDILLEALGQLRRQNLTPRLTIVGSGPESSAMQELVEKLGLSEQVTFAGPQRGSALVDLLQAHKILVVPSRYDEPFGVVALEGMACGCVAVGSSGGGLPEAIGPGGMTFPNGDATALAATLAPLLRQPNERERITAQAPAHLAKFHPTVVAESYLALFRSQLA